MALAPERGPVPPPSLWRPIELYALRPRMDRIPWIWRSGRSAVQRYVRCAAHCAADIVRSRPTSAVSHLTVTCSR